MEVTEVSKRVDRMAGAWGPTVLRIVAGLLWLSNVSWKVPPDFGEGDGGCRGLCRFVQLGVDFPVAPGSAWLFDSVVGPNLAIFGWLTLFVEASLAALLLSGRFVRIAAVLGMVQSAGIGLAVANAEGEWYWSYGLMIALHLAVLVSAPTLEPTRARVMAGVTVVYGVVVALAHTAGGFGGDGSFSLFESANDFPGDFGRNVFPGSIGLGLVLALVGVVVWCVAAAEPSVRRGVGWAGVAASAALLATYGPDGLILGLGSRATTVAVLAALGLSLTATGPASSRSASGLPVGVLLRR